MKKFFTGVLLLAVIIGVCQSRTTSQNGSWNNSATWNNLSVPDASLATITVNHIVTIDPADYPIGSPLQVDQLIIGATGSLTISPGAAIQIMNGTGTDLVVNATGQLIFSSGSELVITSVTSFNTTTSNTNFIPGSVVRTSGANLPLASGLDAIDIYLQGLTASLTLGSSWSQLGAGTNLIVNCPGLLSGQISFGGLITALNSLNIQDTDAENSGRVVLSSSSTTMNIGAGGVNITGDSRLYFTTTGSVTLNVAGDFNFSSTSANASQQTSSGTGILNVNGSFNQSSGNWYLASGSGGSGYLNLAGPSSQLNVTGGLFGETGGGTASATITFSGTLNNQTIGWPSVNQVPGGTYNLIINKPSGNVQQTSPLDVSTLALTSGALVTNGNDLTIRGNLDQAVGVLDCTVPTNLSIDGIGTLPATLSFEPGSELSSLLLNRTGASLALANVAIADLGLVTIKAGQITSQIVPVNMYDVLYTNTATMTTGGEIPVSPSALRNLTHSGTSVVNLASSVTVNGDLTVQSSTLAASTNNISVVGNLTTNGPLSQSAGAVFEFLTNTPHSITGTSTATFGGLTFDSPLSISNTSVTLVGGDLNLNSAASLTQTNGTFAFSFPVNGNANIVNNGASIQFKNLSIGGGDTLTAPLNGTLNISGNWSGNGSFLHNGSTVNFNGATALTGSTKIFNNINILSGASLSGTASFRIVGNFDNQGAVNFTGGTCTWSSAGTFGGNAPVGLFNLTVPSATTLNLALNSSLTLGRNLTLTGTLIQTQPQTISIAGNMTGNGAITTAGTLRFTGPASGMTGTGAKKFKGLGVASGAVLTVAASTSFTIIDGGTIEVEGTLNTAEGGTSTVSIPGTVSVLNTGVSTTFTNLTINGVFNASSGTIWLNGNFVNNGTFNHEGGTIGFTGSGSATKSITSASTTEFNNLTVNNNGNAIDVVNNVTGSLLLRGILTVNDAVFDADGALNNKVFVLQSSDDSPSVQDASIAAMSSIAAVTGNITVQRFIGDHGEVNRYISSPVSGATFASITDDFSSVRNLVTWYRESVVGTSNKGYTSGGTATALVPGQGYMVMPVESTPDVTIDFTGPLTDGLNRGDVNFNPTYTTSTPTALPIDDGWNLLGNPYPSGIVWSNNPTHWTATNIENVITVPDLASGHYYSWDASTNTGDLPGGAIAMGQAFWVKANAALPALIIHEAAKTSASGEFFRKSQEGPQGIKITLEQNGLQDNSYLLVRESSRPGYDASDGSKFQNDNFWVGLGTSEGLILGHNSVPNLDSDISLTLHSTVQNAVLSLKFENLRHLPEFEALYLVDQYLGKSQSLTQPYTFAITPSKGSREGRFLISKEPWRDEKLKFRILVYPNPTQDQVRVESNLAILAIEVRNAKGTSVFRLQPTETTDNQVIDLKSFQPGLYLFSIKTNLGTVTQRVFKEN